ncbi:hypothetical protein [Streptomyces sp. SPB162]|uniref:hypothetical protein n=1 Tax=Streptomyces sp. SPB162 TaxID=2940560 RepID=UPI0024053CE1|nr:hypothetical protein [Streptomyces sp. SPB162]MDF9815145.1 hypothetical protein [Streptomyces sp. SPB162]
MSVPVHRDSRTEATRLLCAGVSLDADFRSRVIQQLIQHEERPIAPSLGVDAVPVLASHVSGVLRNELSRPRFAVADVTGEIDRTGRVERGRGTGVGPRRRPGRRPAARMRGRHEPLGR